VSGEGSHRSRLRIGPSDPALEILSIVIAIVLATAVGGVVECNRAAARTHEALSQACQEIAHDGARLAAVHPLHERVRDAFVRAVATARGERLDYDRFTRTFETAAPRGFQPFTGTATAWELARSSDALADVPYALHASLVTRPTRIRTSISWRQRRTSPSATLPTPSSDLEKTTRRHSERFGRAGDC
jgi:hypothetical protein